jgi:hypothetical protein
MLAKRPNGVAPSWRIRSKARSSMRWKASSKNKSGATKIAPMAPAFCAKSMDRLLVVIDKLVFPSLVRAANIGVSIAIALPKKSTAHCRLGMDVPEATHRRADP